MEDVSPLSLGQLWRALRQRWFLASFVTLVAMAGIAAYIFSLAPKYTGRSVVRLAPLTGERSDPLTGRNAATTDPFFIRSETAIIGSEGLSRAVIERLELAGKPEFTGEARPGAAHPWLSDSEVV